MEEYDDFAYLIDPDVAGDRIRKILQSDGSYIYRYFTGEIWKPDWDKYNKVKEGKR